MSMCEIRADDIDQIFSLLEELASGKEVVFRGQTSPADTINTTLQRFSSIPHKQWDPRIDEMLSRFIALVRSTGHFRPEMAENRRARLEYGRHFGVSSPLIDFSRSPYIALFFAFDRLRRDNQHDVVAIYALDVRALGTAWAKQRGTDFDKELENFMRESEAFLEAGFPANVLKYLPYPASWNIRMNRQMGVFIYDTLDYAKLDCSDFEGFVKRMEEPPDPSTGNRSPI